MTTSPAWDSVDNYTADLLTLVADEHHVSADHEWGAFTDALRRAADEYGVVRPNRLRPLVRGVVAPRRIGAFTHRAVTSGLMSPTGEWEVSDDTTGRNSGKPSRCYRLADPSP